MVLPIIAVTILVGYRIGNWLLAFPLMVAVYIPIAAGVTVGLHRYFTHQSFKARTPLKIVLCILAVLALEGKITSWVANHKWHHIYSDKPNKDLHTPLEQEGLWGLLYAHLWWMFTGRNAPKRFAKHLLDDPIVQFVDQPWSVWTIIILRFLVPYLIWGWEGILWAVVLIGFVHHFTWCINSVCHMYGEQPYKTGDQSRNVWWLWLPTLGESWHCTHHAFPWSALQGTSWKDDPSYAIILVLEWVGLAYDVRVPTKEQYKSALKTPITA